MDISGLSILGEGSEDCGIGAVHPEQFS